jgi:hypothetical protein
VVLSFDYLKPQWRIEYKKPLLAVRNNRFRTPDFLFRGLPHNLKSELVKYAGEFYRAIGDEKSYDKSFRKMDFPPTRLYKRHPSWALAKDRVLRRFGEVFYRIKDNMLSSTDEVLVSMDMNRASGVPWSFNKLPKKGDCFNDADFRAYMSDWEKMVPPVWKVVDKTEWYAAADLDNDKVRTFIIPPTCFLFWQKVLFLKQNEAMKMQHSSAYGFNPYGGGVDRIAQLLNVNSVFINYDVVGWDRKLPVMHTIYKLRLLFLPDEVLRLGEWVAKHTCTSLMLHADGTVLLRYDVGNNSGSGCTTNDNILGHDFISSMALFELFEGDSAKLDKCVTFLFGDDNVSSLVDTDKDVEATFREVFRLFGLELDPFFKTSTLEGVEFLGFHFHYLDGWWIPKYKAGRIMAAFCFDIEKKTLSASLSKAYSLVIMSAGGDRELFELMRVALDYYLEELKDSDDPTIMGYVSMGVPTFQDCMCFYTGQEGGVIVTSLVEGGIKNLQDEFKATKAGESA